MEIVVIGALLWWIGMAVYFIVAYSIARRVKEDHAETEREEAWERAQEEAQLLVKKENSAIKHTHLPEGMKKCRHCAKQNNDEASICRYCGREIA